MGARMAVLHHVQVHVALLVLTTTVATSTHSGRWEWLGGPQYLQKKNDLGTPSGRCGAMTWTAHGQLYLFGGTSDSAFLGDLWTFDFAKARVDGKSSAANWKYRGGSRSGNSNGSATWPASRQYATSWTDSEGGLWLWSGFGSRTANDSDGGYLEDLWRYDVEQNRWLRERSVGMGPVPSAKTWANAWTTDAGDLYIFSGFDKDTKIHNDMWRFRSTNRTWEILYNYSHYQSVNVTVHNQTKTKSVGIGLGGVYNCTPAGGAPPAPAACVPHPGARENGYTMVDSDGKLWLFGGSGYARDTSPKGGMNDYWSFDPSTDTWKFEGGWDQVWSKPLPNATDQRFSGGGGGHHGVMGIGSAANLPAADHAGYSWNDQLDGKLWLMGGENGNTDKTSRGVFSDLWSLQPRRGTWTWESGSALPDQPGHWTLSSGKGGQPGARYAGETWVDATHGELWLFGGWGIDAAGKKGYLGDVWRYRLNASS